MPTSTRYLRCLVPSVSSARWAALVLVLAACGANPSNPARDDSGLILEPPFTPDAAITSDAPIESDAPPGIDAPVPGDAAPPPSDAQDPPPPPPIDAQDPPPPIDAQDPPPPIDAQDPPPPPIDAQDPPPPPDAPPTEPPPAGELERLDWRTVRGAPLPATTVTIPPTDLFSMSEQSFVTRSRCDGFSCDYEWHDLSGATRVRRDRMVGVTAGIASADGKRAALVALDELEECLDDEGIHPIARGVLQLLDLATGAVGFELPLRTNLWSVSAFTLDSAWFFVAPIRGNDCLARNTGHLSVNAPFTGPPGITGRNELLQVIDARHWLVSRPTPRGFDLGLVDPLVRDSFAFLGDTPERWEITAGWLHVYLGFGELVQDVVSVLPDGSRRQTVLRDEDWFPFGARSRWIRACLFLRLDGTRDCRVVDALGQFPAANFRVTITFAHPDDAVLLVDGAVVYVGPTADGSIAVQRINLTTGQREVLHPGVGQLRTLGDGTAALLVQNGVAWLIEATREERLADNITNVVTMPRFGGPPRIAGPQEDIAILARSVEGVRFTLMILDIKTRRLATLTDDMFFTPRRGVPFLFDNRCGQPWTTRHAGAVPEGFDQRPEHLFFVEKGQPAAMWILPIDLSSPPQRLATLTGNPAACHSPLVSPDGTRIGFAEDGPEGATTRITHAPLP